MCSSQSTNPQTIGPPRLHQFTVTNICTTTQTNCWSACTSVPYLDKRGVGVMFGVCMSVFSYLVQRGWVSCLVFVCQFFFNWFKGWGWVSCLVFVRQCLTWFRRGWGVVFGFLLSFYFVFLCLFFLLLSIFFFLFFFFLYIFVFLFFLLGKSEILILYYVFRINMSKIRINQIKICGLFYKFSEFLQRFQYK